ncbi:MAG: hypothetical protein M1267_03355 [Candidatus Thermoplasmatota archaeon]|jgi:hypothetical protein|nr:hypothetical protein [Candidatus Thermoplasmatota archaeon]MCL5799973.1 hypothetical protein [Candidatus Thermoplasmatota archaeon]
MKYLTKVIITAAVAFALIGIGTFSTLEYLHEPPKWNVESHYYTYYKNVPLGWPLTKVAYSNFTVNGNLVSIGYFIQPAGGIPVMDLNSNLSWWLMIDYFWLQGETLHWPYTGIAFQIASSILTVNGTYLNLPNFNRDNVLQSANLVYQGTYDSTAGGSYIINTNDTVLVASYVNAGNYSFNFTVTLTPILEIGPYYFNGQPLSFNYQYDQEFIYP